MVLNTGKLDAQVSNLMCYQACITDPVGYYKAGQAAGAVAPDTAERAAGAGRRHPCRAGWVPPRSLG